MSTKSHAELEARLRLIHRIAAGEIPYASDFGKLSSIENVSNLRFSAGTLRKLGYELGDSPSVQVRVVLAARRPEGE